MTLPNGLSVPSKERVPATPVLELRQVTRRRTVPQADGSPRELLALSDVSISVESGGLHLVLGPSGSGKSTLLRLLNRLEDADEGEVLLGGEEIRTVPVLEVRRRVGMVQQRPALFEGTVLDNLCYGPRLRRVPDSECRPKAAHCLGLVGLGEDLLPRPAGQLSGGQQHRVALARALANDPEVLLLDEPTSSLDPTAVAGILRLVASLNRDLGLTVVLVTHSLALAKELGGRMALLVEGRLVEEGETEEVLRTPKTETMRLFLEGRLEERPTAGRAAGQGV